MTTLTLSGVSRAFAGTRAVDRVDLEILSGEFVALLGPSGCGKTTLLRLIAGLERPDSGEIALGDRIVAGKGVFIEPEHRGLGMVFQSYALWPTMTVAENVAFGLRVRGMARKQIDAAVDAALRRVGLAEFGTRRPAELSGGQRQRAALARCLAMSPSLILLDEPLANLDAHLRALMLDEFRRISEETRATFVFVTHDQAEAMAIADRIVVMDRGRIEQSGAPETLYAQPATAMVARFIGDGVVLPVNVRQDAQAGGSFAIGGRSFAAPPAEAPGARLASVRPENVALADPEADGALPATVISCIYRGGYYALRCGLDDGSVLVAHTTRRMKPGDRIALTIDHAWLIPPAGP